MSESGNIPLNSETIGEVLGTEYRRSNRQVMKPDWLGIVQKDKKNRKPRTQKTQGPPIAMGEEINDGRPKSPTPSQRSQRSDETSTSKSSRINERRKVAAERLQLQKQKEMEAAEIEIEKEELLLKKKALELKKLQIARENALQMKEIELDSDDEENGDSQSDEDFETIKSYVESDVEINDTEEWVKAQRKQTVIKDPITEEQVHEEVQRAVKPGRMVEEKNRRMPLNLEETLLKMAQAQIETQAQIQTQIQLQSQQTAGADIGMFMKRQVALTPLREFSGKAEEWPGFYEDYKSSTEICGLKDEDNLKRLCKCLRGKAKELFLDKLKRADQVPKVMDQMEELFGNPKLIIQTLIKKVNDMSNVKEEKPDSVVNFAHAVDNLVSTMLSLKSVGHLENPQLIDDIVAKLPTAMKSRWADHVVENKSVNISDLAEWLCKRAKAANVLRSLDREQFKEKRPSAGTLEDYRDEIPTAAGLSNSDKIKKFIWCVFCDTKGHEGQNCRKAPGISLEERKERVMKRGACFTCLRKAKHLAKDCKLSVSCSKCSSRHYEIMCNRGTKKEKSEPKFVQSSVVVVQEKTEVKEQTGLANPSTTPDVLLQTIMVYLLETGSFEKKRIARALIDSGSSHSYITKEAVKDVGYEPTGEQTINHNLYGGSSTGAKHHFKYKMCLASIDRNYSCNFDVFDEETICGDIARIPEGPWMKELSEMGIMLTDKGQGSTKIDILIGADVIGKLMTGRKIDLKNGPTAIEYSLGWGLTGKMPKKQKNSSSMIAINLLSKDEAIKSLWQLDTLGITDPAERKSKEELHQATMEHFMKTIRKDEDGRYEVALPWIVGHGELPSNRVLAERRLDSATKRLKSQHLIETYQQVFDEWKNEGVIEEVPEEQIENYGHYLPHRAVVKQSSETTKLRPVFDASAHEAKAPSLNDCLEVGMNLLELIPDVLNRFRLHKYGIVADIKKAFLQIGIRPEDRDFLRFLWWDDMASELTPEEPPPLGSKLCQSKLKVLRHRRVPFGARPSPFLLGATINYHLDRAPSQYAESAKKLKKSFYVDNCCASEKDETSLSKFMEDSKILMHTAKFDLRGWMWNRKDQTGEKISVLGLLWDLGEDTLRCDLTSFPKENTPLTKRSILSAAHKIFDPIGFTAPVTLLPKLLLQKTWEAKIEWDAELPDDIGKIFKEWIKQIQLLDQVKVSRWLFRAEYHKENWTLHVFTDASKDAYSVCVFIRAESERGITVQLVQAKTRVAPVKAKEEIFIPRLELLGCCIGARLAKSVKLSLEYENIPTQYWTDSGNALYWIQKEEQWGVFVMNRVKEIRTLTNKDDWKHIPGKLNPADLPSRGCSVKQLIESSWWEGPGWLRQPEEFWPVGKIVVDEDVVNRERRKTVASHFSTRKTETLLERIIAMRHEVTYQKVLRVIARIHRFINNIKKNSERKFGELSAQELDKAEITTAKLIQMETLNKESDWLKNIRVFSDNQDIVRVKTKISNNETFGDFRQPIVLPPKHDVVRLMIKDYHLRLGHAGIQTLLCALREKFWIVRGRKVIRSSIRDCVRCRRYDSKHLETNPTALPLDRTREAAVFEITGVDLAGPLYLKGGNKCWICLFTCAVYRTLHLELVTSPSTDAFLQAFRRFVARRGRPSIIYSDNGTNFVGADNLMKNLDWKLVESYAALNRIQWKFNPPTAAWWGGFWERLVRMIKGNLRKVLGRASLKMEELQTILCDAECVINSRPLTYLSEDTEDLAPLTPAMFLQQIRESGVPDLDMLDGKALNSRFKYRNKIRQDLRERFRKEYLGTLLQPGGKVRQQRNLKPGDIVLIGGDGIKRIDWILAKILKTYASKDGIVRVVRLKTQTGELTRPVQRIYPLEVAYEEREDTIKDLEKAIFTRSGRRVKAPDRLTY